MKKKDKIKKRLSEIKISAKTISFIALGISLITVYFQFFHINHELKYATLHPVLNGKEKTITFPILLKNTGNQTETVIDFRLLLEVKNKNETPYYKRISQLNNEDFFSILKPGESKRINLIGDYSIYLFGTIELSGNNFTYKPITELENLNLLLKTKYLTKNGVVATENRIVGKVTFTEGETVKRIDCPAIELQELNMSKNDFEIFQYTIIPNDTNFGNLSIDFTDSTSIIKNLDKLLLIERILSYDKEKNQETLKILKKVLKPYR